MGKNYRVGTRTSPLALKQVEEVSGALRKFYPDFCVDIVGIETYGDEHKSIPISDIEGSDFFTREIDEALISGKIDFAIHSAKDLADNLREELLIAAVTSSIDPYDVLVSKSGLNLEELAQGATIGTSSQRRKEALKKFRPDFHIINIRGNIQERLRLLDNDSRFTIHDSQKLDAIVIAAAGLIRLGLAHRITQRISFEILQPHPLQGALAIVVRTVDKDLIKLFNVLDTRNKVS